MDEPKVDNKEQTGIMSSKILATEKFQHRAFFYREEVKNWKRIE